MDGFALLVEIDGVEVLSRVLPPEPVIPALPKRVTVKRRERPEPVVIDTTAEAVS